MPNTSKGVEIDPVREKLIALLTGTPNLFFDPAKAKEIADYLIANGVTVQKWIPVTERLPEEMGKYLCRYVFGKEEGYPFEQVLWYYPQLEKSLGASQISLRNNITRRQANITVAHFVKKCTTFFMPGVGYL